MGACCSQVADVPLPSTRSFARITDAELQLRIPSTLLAAETAAPLIESACIESLQSFTRAMDSCLKSDVRPLDKREFGQRVLDARDEAVDEFRCRFRQGSSGEGVPFSAIKTAEEALKIAIYRENAFYAYCNMYRSFHLCSSLKRKVIEEELIGNGNNSKAKLIKMYEKSAAGTYSSMCRSDLENLIDQASKLNPGALVTLLKKQYVADREIMKKERSKAETVSGKTVPNAFASFTSENSSEGEETYAALQSRLSVLDLIDRLPEDDGETSADMYGDDFITLQCEGVSMAPLKKHRSADDFPLQFPGRANLDLTNSAQKANKFILQESAEENSSLLRG